jgi:hypothetical protein
MSFILSNRNQARTQIADEESSTAKLLNQDLRKTSNEELSKEINLNINIGMETPTGVTEETKKSDFASYSLILGGAVILGVVGYIYYSMDKKSPKTLQEPAM